MGRFAQESRVEREENESGSKMRERRGGKGEEKEEFDFATSGKNSCGCHCPHRTPQTSLISTPTHPCRTSIQPYTIRPRPLLTVPNVTAHPSTASVPITVLLYNGPLLCGFSVGIKGLS